MRAIVVGGELRRGVCCGWGCRFVVRVIGFWGHRLVIIRVALIALIIIFIIEGTRDT